MVVTRWCHQHPTVSRYTWSGTEEFETERAGMNSRGISTSPFEWKRGGRIFDVTWRAWTICRKEWPSTLASHIGLTNCFAEHEVDSFSDAAMQRYRNQNQTLEPSAPVWSFSNDSLAVISPPALRFPELCLRKQSQRQFRTMLNDFDPTNSGDNGGKFPSGINQHVVWKHP
jgi:hypothetical protein